MTLQEAKDRIAKKYGYPAWGNILYDLFENNITPKHMDDYENEAAELYARSKWDEACEAQKQMIWDDLKIHVTTPKNVFGDVVSATRIVRATYEHAPKPEFR